MWTLLLGLAIGAAPMSPVVLLPVVTGGETLAVADAQTHGCDDGTVGGTLVQRGDIYYGNRFTASCSGARLQSALFAYHGQGLAGPYAFRLHLIDPSCGAVGVTEVLTVPGAPDRVEETEIDLSALGWCVGSDFMLLLEPLTCANAADCLPALAVDATSDASGSHCAVVSAPGIVGRECRQARSSDGRGFDFRLRVRLDCAAPSCATTVTREAWGPMKRLYR